MVRRVSILFLAWATVLAQFEAVGARDDRPISNHCNARLSAVGSSDPLRYNKELEWAAAPAEVLGIASAKLPNTVETIVIAPVTPEQYGTIFPASKDRLSKAQEQEVALIQTALKDSLKKDHGDELNSESFGKTLSESKASFTIIVGHNLEGRMPLLDGHSVYLDEFLANARENQRVIFVSCDSANYVSNKEMAGTIRDKVTYEEAFKIAASISGFIENSKEPVSILDIQSQLDKTVDKQKRYKVALFIMKIGCALGTAIVVGLVIRKLDPCSDENKLSDCDKTHTKSSNSSPSHTEGLTGEVASSGSLVRH